MQTFTTGLGRRLAIVSCLLVAAGCNGPTKTGQEAREEAYERATLMGAQVQYDQARQAFLAGDFSKSLREINAAIDRRPSAADYYVLRGQIHLEQQRLERALADFNKAIELEPPCAEACYFAGVVYQRWSDDEKAYDSYLAAYEAKEDNQAYLLAAAESLVAMERFDEAKAMLEPKLAYFENSAAMHELLGRVSMLRGDYRAAAECFHKAVRLDDDDMSLKQELVRAQYLSRDFGACLSSIQHIEAGSAAVPIEIQRTKARCLFDLGRTDSARDAYAQLVRQFPEDVEGWVEYGATAARLKDWRRVGESSSRLLSLAPYRSEGYVLKGMVEQARGDASAAQKMFARASQIDPKDPTPHLMMAILLEQIGDTAGASRERSQATNLARTNMTGPDPSAVAGVTTDRMMGE